jgi:hypothetical protein
LIAAHERPLSKVELIDLSRNPIGALMLTPPFRVTAVHNCCQPLRTMAGAQELAHQERWDRDLAAGIAMPVALAAVGLQVQDETRLGCEELLRCLRKPLRPNVNDNSVIGKCFADTSVSGFVCSADSQRQCSVHATLLLNDTTDGTTMAVQPISFRRAMVTIERGPREPTARIALFSGVETPNLVGLLECPSAALADFVREAGAAMLGR